MSNKQNDEYYEALEESLEESKETPFVSFSGGRTSGYGPVANPKDAPLSDHEIKRLADAIAFIGNIPDNGD